MHSPPKGTRQRLSPEPQSGTSATCPPVTPGVGPRRNIQDIGRAALRLGLPLGGSIRIHETSTAYSKLAAGVYGWATIPLEARGARASYILA
jgi:hypothetical protein